MSYFPEVVILRASNVAVMIMRSLLKLWAFLVVLCDVNGTTASPPQGLMLSKLHPLEPLSSPRLEGGCGAGSTGSVLRQASMRCQRLWIPLWSWGGWQEALKWPHASFLWLNWNCLALLLCFLDLNKYTGPWLVDLLGDWFGWLVVGWLVGLWLVWFGCWLVSWLKIGLTL